MKRFIVIIICAFIFVNFLSFQSSFDWKVLQNEYFSKGNVSAIIATASPPQDHNSKNDHYSIYNNNNTIFNETERLNDLDIQYDENITLSEQQQQEQIKVNVTSTDDDINNNNNTNNNQQSNHGKKRMIEQVPEGGLEGVARDRDGNLGYVHDPTYLVKNPPSSQLQSHLNRTCHAPLGRDVEGRMGWIGFAKIQIIDNNNTLLAGANSRQPRILCIVYTHQHAHDHALRAIVETYATHCDGFLASSNVTDPSLGAVNILHRGPEAYQNIWQKVRSTWIYVHKHYINDFDWFHIGGDNMYVIPENLRLAAWEQEQQEQQHDAIYMGSAMVLPTRPRFLMCGGGAGYTLNRNALDRLISERIYKCHSNDMRPDEDVVMATCLKPLKCLHNTDIIWQRRQIQMTGNETNAVDQSNVTLVPSPRYHPLDIRFHARWRRNRRSNWGWKELLRFHDIDTSQEGLQSISSTSISFHFQRQPQRPNDRNNVEETENERILHGMRRYHALLYNQCEGAIAQQLNQMRRRFAPPEN